MLELPDLAESFNRADHHTVTLPIVTRMGAPFFRSLGMLGESITPTRFVQLLGISTVSRRRIRP
jgi:hypothetical protein